MKHETKKRKQLERVKEWLSRCRPDIEMKTITEGWQPEFNLLIAMEQLVEYLEMEESK